MNLAFDIHLRTYPKGKTHFILEVTEDYEGDKWIVTGKHNKAHPRGCA